MTIERFGLPRLTVVGALVAMIACGDSPSVDLAAAAELEGEWILSLQVDPVPGPPMPPYITGTVALLANRSGATVADFPGIPFNVGVHDLRLGDLSPGLADEGALQVAGGVVSDSVILVIGPNADRPLWLRARFQTDSIAGSWIVSQRAGSNYTGSFTLRRR